MKPNVKEFLDKKFKDPEFRKTMENLAASEKFDKILIKLDKIEKLINSSTEMGFGVKNIIRDEIKLIRNDIKKVQKEVERVNNGNR